MSRASTSNSLGSAFVFAAGTLVGWSAYHCWALVSTRKQKSSTGDYDSGHDKAFPFPEVELPSFAWRLEEDPSLHRIKLREWEDLEWRRHSGWKGRDYLHNAHSRAVRVLTYLYEPSSKKMIGVVWFGPDAESHRGLCHGGAMSSLMDDFCGHMAFVDSARPWSGATVQVNVALRKPVPVGSILRVVGKVRERKGRKVHIEATLDDGEDGGEIYATLEGLSIDGVKMSDIEDEIAGRTWKEHVCERSGRLQRRDSGWNLGE